MKFTKLVVENFKSLKNVNTPLSTFTCIVGENNSGKSTFIQSLLLFIKGTKLKQDDFYDISKDILITVTINDISTADLAVLGDIHKEKLEKFIITKEDGTNELKLARRYSHDDYSSKLRNVTFVPKLQKFSKDVVDEKFKGQKGQSIVDILTTDYHEIEASKAEAVKTQKAAKELIENYIETLPAEEMEEKDISLESGFDNTIKAFFPEPIYIPAVKDLSDEMKTKDSASFGKLLNILLDVIEDDLNEAKEVFEKLREKLNKTYDENGILISDNRLDKVKQIEDTIQRNLNETFKNVSIELEVPPPEIKTILSTANISADDGVKGPIENKGDGFKRAITFSILRSYVELSHTKEWQKEEQKSKQKDRFLFLFEEPELYLHPKAQNILFEALSLISRKHQMLVTTHSPLFFSPNETTTFIKIKKHNDGKPYSNTLHIDLAEMKKKDQFQLISFETANHAFFSEKIVLVEGDSELIVLPHISKLINSKFDFKNNSISLVKINGKGSFKRYKEFFDKFDIEIFLLADLDILLDGYKHLETKDEHKESHSELMSLVADKSKELEIKLPKSRKYKDELSKGKSKSIYESIKVSRQEQNQELTLELLDELFAFEQKKLELQVLEDHSYEDILTKKRELLAELRKHNIFILEKGDIEAYYPDKVVGEDKPTQAQNYCGIITNKTELLAQYQQVHDSKVEFELIFEKIFS